MTKKQFTSFLKRIGLYYRLRSSVGFIAYLRFVNKHLIKEREQEIDFYREVLHGFKRGDLIFDIGANVGEKSAIFLQIGARVVAVDPDEHNQAILRERFVQYRLAARPVTIVGKAVSSSEGVATMWVDGPGSAVNTLSPKWAIALKADKERLGNTEDLLEFREKKVVETTTLDRLIDTYGTPFFIKIDVEGFEVDVLQGLHRGVPRLSFEVNLPEFMDEGLQCIKLLGKLAPAGQFNYTSDCRNGLALASWLEAAPFSQTFNRCNDKSIEVFWRPSSDSAHSTQP